METEELAAVAAVAVFSAVLLVAALLMMGQAF